MAFIDKLKNPSPTLSFELFPPKSASGWGLLYSTLGEMSRLAPDYISVTYGAGGSTREKTVDLVTRIQGELGIETVAHLTCVGHSQDELRGILDRLQEAGIRNILALRGDPPKGDASFRPHPQGFAHASELIGFIARHYSFHIACAFYPEKHPEAKSLEADIGFLKAKQEAGAHLAVSQLFFDNASFYRFRDRAHKAGVRIPLIAGIMPVVDLGQLKRFTQMCGSVIPPALLDFLGADENPAPGPDAVVERGIEWSLRQCEDLLANGVDGIHLYCLNRSLSAAQVTLGLRQRGHFPVPAPVAAR